MRRAVPKKGGLIMILRDQHHSSDAETRTEDSMATRRLVTGMGIIAALLAVIEILFILKQRNRRKVN